MRCSHCGAQISAGDKTCPNCQTPVPENNTVSSGMATPPVPPVCPHCQAPVKKDSLFCSNCGQPININKNPASDASAFGAENASQEEYHELDSYPKPHKFNGVLIAGLSAACIILAGTLCWMAFFQDMGSSEESVVVSTDQSVVEEEESDEEPVIDEAQEDEEEEAADEESSSESSDKSSSSSVESGNYSSSGSGNSSNNNSSGSDNNSSGSDDSTPSSPGNSYGYILPSNSQYLTWSDLDAQNFTFRTYTLALNEIYARHGRIFNTDWIRAYFEDQSWYNGTISPSVFDANQNAYFNAVEQANLKLLVEYGEAKGWR